jgi:MerR family transcriptional regulator, light-induced transcriptional regulator
MTTFGSREIARFAPGEFGIAQFALQVMSILVGDGAHMSRPPREDVLGLLVRGAMTGDPDVLSRLTGEFRRHRIPAEAAVDIYIPAAVNEIGTAWHDDMIDILDATVAVSRLQDLLREFGRGWRADAAGGDGSVLMVVPEGETHTLGAMIATAQLRRQGVSVAVQLAPSRATLDELMSTRRFDALFLSVGNFESLESGSKIVKTMERRLRRRLPVVAGGSIPMELDAVRRAIGADMATRDVGAALDFLGLQASCHAAQ